MMRKLHANTALMLVLFTAVAFSREQDPPGSQDHSLISRYPGSTIRTQEAKEFDQYNLVLGIDKTGAPLDTGKATLKPDSKPALAEIAILLKIPPRIEL